MTDTRPVRAASKATGAHYTTTRHHALLRGDEVLEDAPATDRYGRWLPPTPKKNLTPARDPRGRFADQPAQGEEEAS